MALYYWDEESGDHVIHHDSEELRFSTRTEALRVVHALLDEDNAREHHPSHRARKSRSGSRRRSTL